MPIKKIKKIILSLFTVSEPTYRIYYALDAEGCKDYWRKKLNLPATVLHHAYFGGCYGRQVYVDFDCHGNPYEKSDEMFMGDLLQYYFPSALWAQGKYKIREKRRTTYEDGEIVWLNQDQWDLGRQCCPEDWLDDINDAGLGAD